MEHLARRPPTSPCNGCTLVWSGTPIYCQTVQYNGHKHSLSGPDRRLHHARGARSQHPTRSSHLPCQTVTAATEDSSNGSHTICNTVKVRVYCPSITALNCNNKGLVLSSSVPNASDPGPHKLCALASQALNLGLFLILFCSQRSRCHFSWWFSAH